MLLLLVLVGRPDNLLKKILTAMIELHTPTKYFFY